MFEQYVRVVEHCLKKEMVGKRMEGLWDSAGGYIRGERWRDSGGPAGGYIGKQTTAMTPGFQLVGTCRASRYQEMACTGQGPPGFLRILHRK